MILDCDGLYKNCNYQHYVAFIQLEFTGYTRDLRGTSIVLAKKVLNYSFHKRPILARKLV